MQVAELKRAVFEAATECARTRAYVRMDAVPDAEPEVFELAFDEWESLGGRNVEMQLLVGRDGAVVAEFKRAEEERPPSLTDALQRRVRATDDVA